MSKKITKPIHYHSVLYKERKNSMTVLVRVDSINNQITAVNLTQHDFSNAAQKHYGNDVFTNITINEQQQLQKLASKFQARTPRELVDRITDRFTPYNERAFTEFVLFLIKKNINFQESVA